ncbi:MAG: hypothetical protein HYY24_10115 [Verrucomicrobia bacterium]|nr:hypothetical protein [Verrucomicrobiota bacterium]
MHAHLNPEATMRTKQVIVSAKQVVEETFTKTLADMIWTANTPAVLPLTAQNFAVGSVLPAVFYMFRRGFRRGKGRFQITFSPTDKARPTIFYVAGKLSQDQTSFAGFDTEVHKDILGDLLLCDALENKGHTEGQNVEIQRAFPVHYFASWLDLPPAVANLRFVPEMLVALLTEQPDGLKLQATVPNGEFPVGTHPESNIFFRVFAKGVQFGVNPADLRGDGTDEEAPYSVEELLMIRLAQQCGEAPEKLRVTQGASSEIQNLWPIARQMTDVFRDDLIVFLRHYGETVPRRALTPMLESLLGLGLFHVFLGCLSIAVAWDKEASVPEPKDQQPVLVFVDASSGADGKLRDLSEQSLEEVVRLIDEATPALMAIRIMDAKARFDRVLRDSVPKGPDARTWLQLLAEVRMEKHGRSAAILDDLCEKMEALATRLEEAGLETEAVGILRATNATKNPVRALADSLCLMMGEKLVRSKPLMFLDSCLMVNEPNGLGRKRRVSRTLGGGRRKMMDVRSLTLSNTLLETLVHRHLAERGGLLSYAEFLTLLRERYGLCVDASPSGLAATREDLSRNRGMLERRLRDLGLLVGVNDAESMKHLRGRFRAKGSA